MDKRKKAQAGTNAGQVRQQNAKSAGKNQTGQYKAEFATETDAQSVRQQNQQSQQKKGQNQK